MPLHVFSPLILFNFMFRTAIVVYQLFYQMVLGKSYDWAAIIKFLSEVSFGAYVSYFLWEKRTDLLWLYKYITLFIWSSVGIGLAFGIISVLWLGFIFNDTVIEITLTVAVSYVAYFTVCSSPILGIFIDYVHTIIMLNFCSGMSKCE